MLGKFKAAATIAAFLCTSIASAAAENVPITGDVASKCTIHTDTPGVYGNPTANKLSTSRVDGGIEPVVRFDVVAANTYRAVITTPDSFVASPSLDDTLAWTGETTVSKVSDAAMSGYDSTKRVYNNTSEFDLTVAGSVWFKSSSTVEYGYNKSLPGGRYTANIVAECIAQ